MAPVNGTFLFHKPSSSVLVPFVVQTEDGFTDVHLIVCELTLSNLLPAVAHESVMLQAVVALPRILNLLRQSIEHHWAASDLAEIMKLLENALLTLEQQAERAEHPFVNSNPNDYCLTCKGEGTFVIGAEGRGYPVPCTSCHATGLKPLGAEA